MTDVSRNVVAVLLVLVIVVSGFGTWSLLNRESTTGNAFTSPPDQDGTVDLAVGKPSGSQAVVSAEIVPVNANG